MSHQPHQQPPAQQKPTPGKKIAGIGCLSAIGFLVLVALLGSLADNDSDKDTDQAKPTASAADHSNLDQAASFACEDFARGYKAAQTRQARIDLADKVNQWAQQSATDRIADNATALARGSEGTAQAWQYGADAFAQACLDAGWDG